MRALCLLCYPLILLCGVKGGICVRVNNNIPFDKERGSVQGYGGGNLRISEKIRF